MRVRKAVFPAAGWGTRFLPATKAQPKEMLPLVDKPIIQYAVEEAVAAGIEQIIIITSTHKGAIEDHFDLNHDTFAKGLTAPSGQFLNPMGSFGYWAPSGGRLAAGDVTMSAYAPINFRVTRPLAQGGSLTPPATDYNSYLYYNDRRVCAYGSNHGGGANFCLADGSVRFLRESLPDVQLLRLSVRNDGGVVDLE